MIRNFRQVLRRRGFGAPSLTVMALSCLIVGLMVASNVSWTGASETSNAAAVTQTPVSAATKPSSFAELVKRLSPAVVNIKVTKVAQMRGPNWPGGMEGPFGELFKRFFQDTPSPRQFKQDGAGSGVIITKDGYILTNSHVVDGAEELTITLADGEAYPAKLVGQDRKTDLAVLKVDAKGSLPIAPMGDSEALQVGDWVLAIGNPFGLGHTVTSGIVSAKGRIIGAGPYDDFIQTDASINPGNSGGPLFNMQGEVVGINTAILPYGRGIGFAIPINTAKPLIPQLVATGTVTRGYLGVGIQSVTDELAAALQMTEKKGALVTDVKPGSPAEQAGIHRGDVIVSYAGKPLKGAHEFPAMVATTPVGEKVTVKVLRDGQTRELPLTVGKFPSEQEARQTEGLEPPTKSEWGLQLQDITPEMASKRNLGENQGVLVVGVESDSPAEQAGIRRGDILVEVDRQPIASVQDVKQILAADDKRDSLLLLVQRRQGNLYVALAK